MFVLASNVQDTLETYTRLLTSTNLYNIQNPPFATMEPPVTTGTTTTSLMSTSTPPKPIPIPCPFSPESKPFWSSHPQGPLLTSVISYVTSYMSNYDASHDISHIHRVISLARWLHISEPGSLSPSGSPRDPLVIILAALMHDIGDKKYLEPSEDGSILVRDFLIAHGADPQLAERVQTICLGVSYSTEIKDPSKTAELIRQHPELAIVQDADRLDALGAVGVGRCFAFGGARGRTMQESVDHFWEKLKKLPAMMKTETGKGRAAILGNVVTQLALQFAEETSSFLQSISPEGDLVAAD
ncbi:hypothetical protein MKZ38_001827 [Zalerion maritima]|uniref:HD/PDEase domain-containing protein n=1 Tax=Zalerion maritima TaxID=339359 RepID=A0AAD5WR93_9PEZI|nr:hypothetical protein MKZ38_001827 [Zalerion maritima]